MTKFREGCASLLAPGRRTAVAMLAFGMLAVGLDNPAHAQTIAKAAPAQADAGTAFNYDITVDNTTGAAITAANVVVVDTLPTLVSYSGFTGTGWSCVQQAGTPVTVECSRTADLPTGVSSLTIAVDAGAPATDTLVTNSVDLDISGTTESTDTADTTIVAEAELVLDKAIVDGMNDVNTLRVRGGDGLQFSVSVQNLGPSPAQNLEIEDTLPTGFIADSAQTDFGDPDWSCSIDDTGAQNIVTCTYAQDLAAGNTAPDLLLDVTMPAVFGNFTNQVLAESDADSTSFPWSSDVVDIEVFLEADLRILKQASPSPVYSGDPLTYTYTITNNGPHPASSITLSDVFDRAGVLGSITLGAGAGDWTCQAAASPPAGQSVLECDSSVPLAVGGSNELVLEVEINAPSTDDPIDLSNTAEVNSAEDLPDPADNFSDEITVEILPQADLALARQLPPVADEPADSEYGYTVEVSNIGPSEARELVLTESVPAGSVLLSANGTGWSCQINQRLGTLLCERATLASGASADVAVTVRLPRNPPVAGQAAGTISSGTAQVSSDTFDPVASNNSAGLFDVTVEAVWSLSISKTASQPLVVPGQEFSYEILIDNSGPSDLSGGLRPLLTDLFDANLSGSLSVCGVGASQPCWSCESPDRPVLVQTLDTDSMALSGIGGARQVAVSPDRRRVYTAGQFDDAVAVLDRALVRDADFGTLDHQSFASITEPRAVVVHPGGRWLISAQIGASADLSVQAIDPADGSLGTAAVLVSGFNEPSDLLFSDSGDVLYVAESGADAISVLAFDAQAGSAVLVEQEARNMAGSNPVALAGVSQLAMASDQQYLYAAAPDDNAIVGFSVDPADGSLSPLGTASVMPQVGGQPVAFRALGVQPQGDELYAGGDNKVLVFERDNGTGLLGTFVATTASSLPERLLTGVSDLVVTPDGNGFIVAARDDEAVTIFTRNELGDMVLRRSQVLADGMQPNALAIDSAGESLYVVATSDDVTGVVEPDRSQIQMYRLAGAGQCDDLRDGDVESGDIVARPMALPAGQQLIVTVAAGIDANPPVTEIDNVASLEDADSNSFDDNALIEIRNATEVSVTKTAPGERPIPGTDFTYTIEITNDGPGGVNGLLVNDLPPVFGANDVGFVSNSLEWQCEATGNACCNSGGSTSQCGQLQPTPFVTGALVDHAVDLAAGSGLTSTLRGDLHPLSNPAGELINQVDLTMPSGIEAFDPADLTSVHQIDIEANLDLWVVKESLGVSEQAGQPLVEYRLQVGNNGPSAAAGLTVEDLLNDISFDTAGASWSCRITNAGQAQLADSCCQFGSGACQATDLAGQSGPIDQVMALAPDARAEFLISVPVDDPSAAIVENTASVSAPPLVTDSDPTNNAETRQVRLLATADLALSKEILAGSSVTPGEQVSFLVTLTNEDGPDGVPVVVQDLLPPELEDVTWTCDATTPIPGDLSYDSHTGLGGQLVEPTAVLSSEDGRHVYLLGAGGEFTPGEDPSPASLAVYERNIVPGPNFGQLTLLEVEIDGVNDEDDSGLEVEGLGDARAMAFSPDQRHLYVAAGTPGSVAVFRRDTLAGSAQFGQLTFVEARFNGSDQPGDVITPVSGLAGASDVHVSADGEHVYLASRDEHAVTTFRRDPGTGVLSFQGKLSAAALLSQSAFALWGAFDIEMPPEDDFVYVTGGGPVASFGGSAWTTTDDRAAVGDRSYFVANTAGVALKWLQQEQPLTIPSTTDLTLSFQHIYSLDWATSCYDVGVLEISTDGGQSWEDVVEAGGVFVQGGYNESQNGLEGNPLSGRPGWCRNSPGWGSGSFNPVEINLSSAVANGDQLMLRFGLGEGSALGNPGWWVDDIELANSDGSLLVDTASGGSGGATIAVLARNADSTAVGFGELELASIVDLPGTADSAEMDAQGANHYVGDSAAESIRVFVRDIDTGELTQEEVVTLDMADPPIDSDSLEGLAAMRVSPDGEHLVASGAAVNRLVVFRRLPFVGTLKPMQQLALGVPADQPVEGGIEGVLGIDFSSDGQQVFTAASVGQLGVFSRQAPDPTYGFLEAVIDGEDDGFGATASGLLGARAAALSDDGRWVFIAGFGQIASGQSGALVVLERDAASTVPGQHLRFRQALRNQQGGVVGMDGALDVTVVDQDIYVAAERSNAVTHFRQDETTGTVSFVASYADGGSIDGLFGAAAVTASPGGDYLYVAGRFDHAVAIFARDAASGALSFAGEARNGVNGVTGMLGANALAVSTDGLHLYVAARESDSVVVLDIDGNALIHRQTFFDGTEGAVLTSPTGLAVSRESSGSEHVMVTSLDADAVTVLKRSTDPSQPDLLGRVRFQQSLVNGSGDVTGLSSPRGIVVDPGNDRVYVASDDDNALVILDRNISPGGQQFGNLTPLEVRRQGVGGVIGLDRPYGLAVSGGARRNIYAASLGGQSVTAFVRRSGSSCPAAGGGNLAEPVFIAAGGTVRFTITGTINPGATGTLENTATLIIGDDITNTGTDDEDSSTPTDIVPQSELVVSKTNNRLSVVAGQTENYRIVVSNDGPSHARDVQITDLLSANSQFDIDSSQWSCRAVGAGLLDRLETLNAEATDLNGLTGSAGLAWAAAADPLIGERVYVAGVLGDALAVMGVDPVSGELVAEPGLELVEGGVDVDGDPVQGLRGARSVVSSADGRLIYVAGQIDNSIVVIEVDTVDDQAPEFGGLRVIQVLDEGSAGLDGLNQPTDLALSADGNQLYVAAANSNAIYVFDRLPSGMLSLNQIVDNNSTIMIDGVSSLVLGPEDEHLYAAGTNASSVAVFARNPDGTLSHLQTRSSPATVGLGGVVDLAMDPDGAQLYAVARDDESIVIFNRDNDELSGQFGRLLSGVLQRIDRTEVPFLASPRSMLISPDGGSAFVATYGSNSLLAFRRDRSTGELSFLTRYVDAGDQSGLAGLSSLVLSQDGTELVAGALLDSAVTRFDLAGFSRCSVDNGTQDVDLLVDIAVGGEVVIDLSVETAPGTDGESCPAPLDPERQCIVNTVDVSLVQDGVTADYSASDVSFLDRAANLVVTKTDNLAEYRGLAEASAVTGIDQLGEHLYVAAPGEPGIGVYAIEPVVGAPTGDYPLRFVEVVISGENGVSQLNGISDVLVSPDGRHVYATSELDSALVAFEREPLTGRLTIQTIYRNNNGGVSGLSGPRAMAMDASGRHLYVAAGNSNAVVVFERQNDLDENDFGDLTWQASIQNGTDDVQDMQSPSDLALSSDDRHVYVAATGSDAVVVLRRQHDEAEPGHGHLTWIQSRRNLVGNVAGLLEVSSVLVAPDDEFVYAAGTGNNAVVAFGRASSSTATNFGRLTFLEAVVDGSNGFTGLAGASSLALLGSAGDWLAVGSPTTDSVALLGRDPATGELSFAGLVSDGDVQNPGSGLVAVEGLVEPTALFALPGSERLYAAATTPGALVALDLDASALAYAGAMIQGQGGAVPGSDVDYVIAVYNEGPSEVDGARVRDIFPPEFEAVSWTCSFSSPDSACPVGGTGNIDTSVTIAAGDTMTFFAQGQLRSDAGGFVVNQVTVDMPAGIVDLDPNSSTAVDDDTIISSRGDLAIEIDNLPSELIAGSMVSYRLRVTNAGPSNVIGGQVEHRLPEALGQTAWVCEADREPGTLELQTAPVPVMSVTRASAISGDGRHVYLVGDTSVGALAVFDRNTLSGELSVKQLIENLELQPAPEGDLTIDGLAGARTVVVSDDDLYVYVLGYDDDAIAVFERDTVSGELTFVQVVRDNIGSVDGLGGPIAMAISDDGEQLYAVGQLDNAVAVFDRDPATGLLTYLQNRRNGQDNVVNLSSPQDLVLADGDATLLVAASDSNALVRFDRLGDGTLAFAGSLVQGQVVANGAESFTVDGLVGVRSLAVSDNDDWLYTYGRGGGDQVVGVFERESPDLTIPALALREGESIGVPPMPVTGLIGASQLKLTSDGRQLYLAGVDDVLGERSLAAFRVLEGADLQFLGRFAGSPATAPGQAHQISVANDGRHVYAAGSGFDNLDIYQLLGGSTCGRAGQAIILDEVNLEAGGEVVFDLTSRVLANARGSVEMNASVDPAAIGQDPDLANNIATAQTTITAAAALSVTKTRLTDPIVAGEPVVWDIDLVNDGPSTIWGVDVNDALPTLPGDIANPGGAGVVAGSAEWICTGTDHLTVNQTLSDTDLSGTRGVTVSPDGLWAAATGQDADSVILYQRDPASGGLTLVEVVSDGDSIVDEDDVEIGVVTGLAGAADVVFSPDQRHLVVASSVANAVVVFAFDSDEPGLTFIEARANADGDVFGLEEPVRVRFDASGDHLYVAARGSNGITVFGRQSLTGRLSWLESQRSGLGGLPVNALDGVRDVVISPDNRFVYAAATEHNSIAIFERTDSGSLTWRESMTNGQLQAGSSVVGLELVQSIAISPKGRHLYAASLSEDSVTLFDRDQDSGTLALAVQYRDGFGGIEHLDGANGVLVSPNGENVYVSALNDQRVVVFERDWSNGELVTIEALEDPSLGEIRLMTAAPDGGSLLLSSATGNGTLLNIGQLAQGYCGLNSSQADELFDSVDLATGGSLSYRVEALVHPGARGVLENSVDMIEPAGTTALTPASQTDTDSGPITVVTDVRLVKTIDGDASSLIGGGTVRFVLDVTNDGPSHAFGAGIVDSLPDSIVSADWTCQVIPTDGSQSLCPAGGSGDLNENVDIVVGERLLFVVDGQIDSDFLGQLSNTGRVNEPGDASDPDDGNNESTISATVSAVADVVVDKFASPLQLIAGEMVTFTVNVDNFGPSDAPSVAINDTLPSGLIDANWTCTASGAATCPAVSGSGDIVETVALGSGGQLQFEIEATVDPFLTTPTVITNVATATLPGTDVSDPDTSNNSAEDSIAVTSSSADLGVTKIVDLSAALPGDTIVYDIMVSNTGPSGATQVQILDSMPVELINVNWTCDALDGADCPTAGGTGDIDLLATLPPGGSLQFMVTAVIDPGVPAGPDQFVTNAISVMPVDGPDDPDQDNNQDSASTLLDLDVVFRDRFEAPDPARGDDS